MNYLNKIARLEEKALIRVVINQCQATDFKETVLCLEKPTYGDFISPCYESDKQRFERWERLVEEHCQNITKVFPPSLRLGAQAWVNRIALNYLSYCRRHEALFGLSRYFMMDFVTREDWNESGRLDEEKITRRLVKDKRLTVLQRYRIACVYCLQGDSMDCVIATLWRQLTPDERESLSGNYDPCRSSEKNRLVLLWSNYMKGGRKDFPWDSAIMEAVADGNRVALMSCWRTFVPQNRQSITMRMACDAFYPWLSFQYDQGIFSYCNTEWMENLVLVKSSDKFSKAKLFNLPIYYSDLLCFFLSELNEEQQLTFFKKAFQVKHLSYILECFLDWPHQDYFLPTIRKLWGILPKHNYGHCLLILASKYSGYYGSNSPPSVLCTKENHYYDYQSLLMQLWEETPDDYKRYLFSVGHERPIDYRETFANEGRMLLPQLLKKYPFTEREEKLFKSFLSYVLKGERRALMLSKSGKIMCSTLIERENWSFISWLLEECLPANEIVNFKKLFIMSIPKDGLCYSKLINNQEKWLTNFADLSFDPNEGIEFTEWFFLGCILSESIPPLPVEGVSSVERIRDFCSPPAEKKK